MAQPRTQTNLERALEFLRRRSRSALEQGLEAAAPVGRQIGLTGRYLAEGGAGLAGVVTNPLAAMGAAATGDMRNFVPLQEQVSQGLTALGFPQPQGAVEETVGNLSRAVAGGGLTAGAARAAVPLATGQLGRATLAELAAMPGRQLAAGATGEGARMAAEAGGAGPIGQTLAAIGGGAVPFVGAPATASSIVDDLRAAYRPGSTVMSGPIPPPPRGPSPFDYVAYEQANPQARPFEETPPLPEPRTYEEAVDQVQGLRQALADADRDVRLSTSTLHPSRAGLRATDRRAQLERQLDVAQAAMLRLRPPAPERQPAPGTSEAARAYLERLGMGRVAELGSTRAQTPEPQAMRRGQRPAGDINQQTQALIGAIEQQAADTGFRPRSQPQLETMINPDRVLPAARERFARRVSRDDRLINVDELLVEAGVKNDANETANIFGLTNAEAEALSAAATKLGRNSIRGYGYAVPASALPERYTKDIGRYTKGLLDLNDLVVTFSDPFDPSLSIDEQGFFPEIEPANVRELQDRLRARVVETDSPTSLDEAFGHRLHTVRSAAFKAALDDAGISYRTPRANEVGSEYYYVSPADPDSNEPDLKVRFSDHAKESGLHGPAFFNLNTEETGGADVRAALRSILASPVYNPNAPAPRSPEFRTGQPLAPDDPRRRTAPRRTGPAAPEPQPEQRFD